MTKPALLKEILRAVMLVLVGGIIITAINVGIRPSSKPYYAVIAKTRVDTQIVEMKKHTGDITYVAHSGTDSK